MYIVDLLVIISVSISALMYGFISLHSYFCTKSQTFVLGKLEHIQYLVMPLRPSKNVSLHFARMQKCCNKKMKC